MSRIITEIQRINRAKANLRTAIVAKGGTLSETAKIDEYADVVRSLPSGGQTMIPIKLKNGNVFYGWSLMTELPPVAPDTGTWYLYSQKESPLML